MRGIIGRKIGMTQVFDDVGNAHAATVVEAGPCFVTQVKTAESDGYNAIQVGFEDKREKLATKPEIGHVAKANLKPFRVLKEFRDFEIEEPLENGAEIKADIFNEGDSVSITGVSKGRGFAGVVKRHNFAGGPKTHGQSDRWRAPGSIGQSSWPSRVMKGMKMGGRMGGKKSTVQNLQILKVDSENNIIIIKGAIPGANRGIVLIRK
jgi:large subunit ribosomal protein L3